MTEIANLIYKIETIDYKDLITLKDEIGRVCNNNLNYFSQVLYRLTARNKNETSYPFYFDISDEIINVIDWKKFNDDEIKNFMLGEYTLGIIFNLTVVLSNIYPKLLNKGVKYFDTRLIKNKIVKYREYGFCSQEQLDILLNADNMRYQYYAYDEKSAIIDMNNLYKPEVGIFKKFDILHVNDNIITVNKIDKITKDTRILINGAEIDFEIIDDGDNYKIKLKYNYFTEKHDVYYQKIYYVNYDFQLAIVGNFLIKDLVKIVESYLY